MYNINNVNQIINKDNINEEEEVKADKENNVKKNLIINDDNHLMKIEIEKKKKKISDINLNDDGIISNAKINDNYLNRKYKRNNNNNDIITNNNIEKNKKGKNNDSIGQIFYLKYDSKELNKVIIMEGLFNINFNNLKKGKKEIEKYCICLDNNQYHLYVEYNQRMHYGNRFIINDIVPEIYADKYALNKLEYLHQDNYIAFLDGIKIKIEEKVLKKLVKSKSLILLLDKGLIAINEYINIKLNRLQYENDVNPPPKNFRKKNYFIHIDETVNFNNILNDLTKYQATEFYQYANEQNLINYNREKCIYYLVYDHIDHTSLNAIVKLSNNEKP